MNERRDLGLTATGAAILMLSMAALAQCSARTPTSGATEQVRATVSRSPGATGDRPVARGAAKEEDDEAASVKNIGHALQTIGANPTLSRTYGIDQ